MKYSIRILAVTLAVLMIFPALYSCADEKNPNETTENTQENTAAGADNTSQADTEPVDERLSHGLEVRNMNGYTYRVYGRGANEGGDWNVHDMISEEPSDDQLDNAVYQRNLYLEETYNFTLELTESSLTDPYQEISTNLLGGDMSFDDYCVSAAQAANLAKDGLLINLNTLDYLDFEKPYWDSSLLKPLTVGGKLFMASGDISVVAKEGIRGFYFNKSLIKDYGLESPYDLVENNRWTFDQMFTMTDSAGFDVNSDDKMDDNDDYGFQGQGIAGMVLYQGSGESIISKNEDDAFVITAGEERSVDVMSKIVELFNSKQDKIYTDGNWQRMLQMFNNNQALFYTEVMLHVKTMRSYEVDFGIIPTPKYNEDQDSYYHMIDSFCNYFHTIPYNAKNPDDSAYILEVMAAASRYYITPAYYDVLLKSRYARDEESSAMLDIIFSSYHLELGDVYGFGGLYAQLNTMLDTGNTSIASTIRSYEKTTNKYIEKTVEKFDKIG